MMHRRDDLLIMALALLASVVFLIILYLVVNQ